MLADRLYDAMTATFDLLSESPSAATGTVMRPETMRRYAREAGFDDAVVLDIEHEAFRFYRLN